MFQDENATGPFNDDAPGAAGNRIGPYKLLQCLGEGGMGTVWQAEQMEPVRRAGAIKLIKGGRDSNGVWARSRAVGRAWGLMYLPHSAKVLGGGRVGPTPPPPFPKGEGGALFPPPPLGGGGGGEGFGAGRPY